MQQRLHQFLRIPSQIAILASVKVRLTLIYLGITVFVMFMFGGILYGFVSSLTASASDVQMETTLYQHAQQTLMIYTNALANGQPMTAQPMALASGEIVVLLHLDGTMLDSRGSPSQQITQQVQTQAESGLPTFNIGAPSPDTTSWHATNLGYRFVLLPLMDQNTRIANLMVGLPRSNQAHIWSFWLPHALAIVVISTIIGYVLASMAIQPVQKITQMADEITATDLRRRLHLARHDEFGALAATFDQMLVRLEAAFKRQSQFTADASHELRTPLTIMNLDLNRALTQVHTAEEQHRILEQIQVENERMTMIVNSLLLLARADTGQSELHHETVDLGDIALESVERLLSLAQQGQVALTTGALPELLVTGDRNYLSRMLTNLIENAIKYTSGVGTCVYVELATETPWAVLRVRDDGPGIGEEHLSHLFERFYRADKARTRHQANSTGDEGTGGIGLGLAIVQWIVQAHHGEVNVISQIGAGTTFEVRLPETHA